METLLQDLRYAFRILRKNPVFAMVAVLTLAIGIGANTAIFSVTNALFLRPLPTQKPELMVRLYSLEADSEVPVFSYFNYTKIRDRIRSIPSLAAHQETPVSFSTGNLSDTIRAEVVSGNYFLVYDLSPVEGRLLTPQDDLNEGAHPVAVISYRLWEKYFQKSTEAIGKKVYLNGKPFQIIGVTPASFRGSYLTTDADLWASIAMHEELRPRGIALTRPGWGWLNVTGRMKDGISLKSAQSELNQITLQLRKESPDTNRDMKLSLLRASSLPEELSQKLAKALRFLTLVAALILLVVCANVAGALLPRIISRRRELAIRSSLGAGRMRLIRQWFTECFLLCLLGGACGILVALWSKEGLKVLLPSEWQAFVPAISIDAKVLGFAAIVSFATAIFCAIAPLFHFRDAQIQSGLKGETGGVPRHRLFGAFVSAQTAVSLLLLIVAALLLRSLNGSASFQLGFDEKNLLVASIDTRRHGFTEEQGRRLFQQLQERLKRIPLVKSVSYATVTPLDSGRESQGYLIPGRPEIISIDNNSVGPNYFSTLGIPILSGRAFTEQDMLRALPVAIVNGTMAKKFWPHENAIGKKLLLEDGPELEIIGVAKDIQYYSVGEKPRPYLYLSANTLYIGQMTLQIRTSGKPEDFIPSLMKEIAAVDRNLGPFQVMSFAELRKVQLFPLRALSIVSTLVGIVALILTTLGIYGVVSYSVTQRTKEIGLRMALGSPLRKVMWMVLRQGMTFVMIGSAVGVLAALLTTRFLSAILFQVAPNDFTSFTLTTTILLFAALAAASIPTRRISKIDPNTTLRYE